jgi:hypothetical protein
MENIEEKAVEQEVVEQAEEKNVEQETGSIKIKRPKQFVQTEEDNVIKIDLRKKPEEDAIQEQSADDSNDTVEEPGNEESGEEVVEEVRDTEQEEQPVLEEIKEEEVEEEQKQTEEVEAIEEKVEEAVEESKETGEPLPENIQKVVDFINDTGGSLEDYVRLNQDYSKLNETQLIREYYETTKPHLEREDIDLLMEDFSYDEELDEPKTIRKAKIAFKEEAAKAKNHLESLKTKYYEEVKAGSRLTSDQQKAVDFFNRYNKEQKETSEVAERQKSIFLNKTNDLFSKDFKGFDYSVGDKKYRFNVKDVDAVKESQSDLNNFVKKFLNKNNEMENASEYHKSLFTAMNPDSVAKHFYEQGKADAMKESMARTKNVDMAPRGTHEQVTSSNGWTVKAVNGEDTSRLRIKIKK